MTGQLDDVSDEVGAGWHPLIAQLHIDLLALDSDYRVSQVKEKFGELRVYFGQRRNPRDRSTDRRGHRCVPDNLRHVRPARCAPHRRRMGARHPLRQMLMPMPHQLRDLYPWEARTGCPSRKAKPGERCKTLRPLHIGPWTARELRMVGSPTTAHRSRYRLWCYLWGRDTCTRGATPTIIR